MMNKGPICIEDDNLSVAWKRAFDALMQQGSKEITPLIVSITGFDHGQPRENLRIRDRLDHALRARGRYDCHTVANTLFPASLWNPAHPRSALFNRYLQIWPSINKYRDNRHGTYFQRLIAFGDCNQLEHVISIYLANNHRRSALQASIFDPLQDHTNQRQRGFPCLQHVSFTPNDQNLTVTGVYATQHIFEKAYGNYLGLCALGRFMAHEMGLELAKMVCIANVERLGNHGKHDLAALAQELSELVN